MRDWTFDLSNEESDDDAYASILDTNGRKHATIRIGEKFWEQSPEDQRTTIVHELLHTHYFAADNFLYYDLRQWRVMSKRDHLAMYATYRRYREYGIDGIAEAVAVHYPLIEW